jgi:hypothetical protein
MAGTLDQCLAHQALKRGPKSYFVAGSCLAGVLIGLYAGIVTKGSESALGTDWQVQQSRSQDSVLVEDRRPTPDMRATLENIPPA